MSDTDGAILCKGVAKSRSLTSLDLSGNLLGKLTCWELKISIQKNRSLEVRCPRVASQDVCAGPMCRSQRIYRANDCANTA